MTTTSTRAPAGLALHPGALADAGAALRRCGAAVQDAASLHPPDTGVTASATASTWAGLEALGGRIGSDASTLGRRLDAFVETVTDVDGRTRAELDRVRGGARW